MEQAPQTNEYEHLISDLIDVGVRYGTSLLMALLILIVGALLARWISRLVRNRLEKVERFDQTLTPILESVGSGRL